MKSIAVVFFALAMLVAVIYCVPTPPECSKGGKCNEKGHIFLDNDYGPSVTPYIPTMKPRVRTLIVPPLCIHSTQTPLDEEDNSTVASIDNEIDYEENEEDNMV